MKTKKLVLALGESTHTHIIECKENIEYNQGENEVIEFLLKDTGVITHEEHDRIVLDKGFYTKINQVEFNPFDNSISNVYD